MCADGKIPVRLPVICVREETWSAGSVLNPNLWLDESKGIVQSCLAEYSAIKFCCNEITDICKKAGSLCEPDIKAIKDNWLKNRFDISNVDIFSEQPALHLRIEGFFAGIKSFLDLIVQLISSESIVNLKIDGFHSKKNVCGGNVLNALERNAPKSTKGLAAEIYKLINEHKQLWIDKAIAARHELIHPLKGTHQLMFRMDFEERNTDIICKNVFPPMVGSDSIDKYANQILDYTNDFSMKLIEILKKKCL